LEAVKIGLRCHKDHEDDGTVALRDGDESVSLLLRLTVSRTFAVASDFQQFCDHFRS